MLATKKKLTSKQYDRLARMEDTCASDGIEWSVKDLQEILKKECWSDVEIHYSIGGGQGSGVVLEGRIDVERFVQRHMLGTWIVLDTLDNESWLDAISITVDYRHRGIGVGSNIVEMEYDVPDSIPDNDDGTYEAAKATFEKMADEIHEAVKEYVKDKEWEIYRTLDDEHDYHYEESHLIEMAEANGIELEKDDDG